MHSQIKPQERRESTLQELILERSRRALLQAKGSCWYCDAPVDNVRRFCSLSCRDDYFEEESEFN